MSDYGFLRVAAATPRLRVADCTYNAEHIIGLLKRAEKEQVALLVFPELSLTGPPYGPQFLEPAYSNALLQVSSMRTRSTLASGNSFKRR